MSLMDNKKWAELANTDYDSFFIFRLAKHNRVEKTKPKKAANYCGGCDMIYLRVGKKCPICGRKEKTKHRKKDMGSY